jgi:hypothetical protein
MTCSQGEQDPGRQSRSKPNPVVTVASGSSERDRAGSVGFRAWWRVPNHLTVEEGLPILKNGFIIADFTPGRIVIRFFADLPNRWRPSTAWSRSTCSS